MKKSLFILMAVFTLAMLVACAPMASEEIEETTVGESAVNDDFTLSIAADNSVYKADEAIICHAILTYIGEEPITLLHSDPLVVFYINGGIFKGGGARQDSLNRTTFEQNQEMTVDFVKSGGWSGDDPNAEFFKSFYAEDELILPKGQYTLAVQIEYSTDENDMRGTQQVLEAIISVTVD